LLKEHLPQFPKLLFGILENVSPEFSLTLEQIGTKNMYAMDSKDFCCCCQVAKIARFETLAEQPSDLTFSDSTGTAITLVAAQAVGVTLVL
jgi:hypothetical protein